MCSSLLIALPVSAEAHGSRRLGGRRLGGGRVVAPRVYVGPYGGVAIRGGRFALGVPSTGVAPEGVVAGRRQWPARAQASASPPLEANTRSQMTSRSQLPSQPGTAEQPAAFRLVTSEELAAMNDTSLIDALIGVQYQLNHRLGRLKTGAGWQRHLAFKIFEESATGAPTVDVEALRETLERFDKVGANSKYAKISSLPSFAATRLVLSEMVLRFDGPRLSNEARENAESRPASPSHDEINPNDEILPTPTPAAAKPEATPAERSILKR